MPSITSTIRMMDAMSGPLARVIKQMDTLVSSAQRVNQIMNTGSNALVPTSAVNAQQKMIQNNQQIVQLTQVINNNYQQMNNTINNNNTTLNRTNNILNANIYNQGKFNNQLKDGANEANKLLNKVMAIASTYLGFRAIKGFLGNSLEEANGQIRAEQRLQAIMTNINGMTQDGIELVKKQAYELEKTTAIAANVGMFGQSQLAQYVYNPENINALTEAMYNLATETYGVNVKQEQIKQTADLIGKSMMGQLDALSRNGFKLSTILDEQQIKLFKTGNEFERTAMLVEVLNENQEELAKMMANTPEGAIQRLGNAWGGIKTIIGYGLIPTFQYFADLINENMPMIQEVFKNVFYRIFDLMNKFIQYGSIVANFFIQKWPYIEPVITAIVTALGAYVVGQKLAAAGSVITTLALQAQTIATVGLKVAWQGLNTAMKANVIIAIVSALIALGVWLYKTWQTNDNFVAGVMRAWNWLANTLDKINIGFKRAWNGIVNAAEWMKVQTLEIVETMINALIDDINKFIDLLNKIPGVSIDAVSHVSFAAQAAADAEAVRQAGEDAVKLMEDNAAKKAAEREQRVLDMLDNRAAKRAKEEAEKEERFQAPQLPGLGPGMWDSIDNINSVGEVGKIKDKVDISSEDLKTMRELAEMKNIQNFVTLQPAFTFGDTHIKQDGRTVEEIIANISDVMEEYMVSSARGVFNV